MGKQSVAKSEHDIVFELLPWKVNGTLSIEQNKTVETHIEHCAVCRQEIEFLNKTFDTIGTIASKEPVQVEKFQGKEYGNIEKSFAKTMQRIEQSEIQHGSTNKKNIPTNGWFEKVKDFFQIPNYAWAGVTTAGLLIAVMSFYFWPQTNHTLSGQTVYKTLSSQTSDQTPLRLNVRFKKAIDVSAAKSLIESTGISHKLYSIDSRHYIIELTNNQSEITEMNALLQKLQADKNIESVNVVLNK